MAEKGPKTLIKSLINCSNRISVGSRKIWCLFKNSSLINRLIDLTKLHNVLRERFLTLWSSVLGPIQPIIHQWILLKLNLPNSLLIKTRAKSHNYFILSVIKRNSIHPNQSSILGTTFFQTPEHFLTPQDISGSGPFIWCLSNFNLLLYVSTFCWHNVDQLPKHSLACFEDKYCLCKAFSIKDFCMLQFTKFWKVSTKLFVQRFLYADFATEISITLKSNV